MKLEVGKTYATRNGKSVKIISMDDDDTYPFNGDNMVSYTADGVRQEGKIDSRDLIGEVVSPKTTEFKVGDKVFDILTGNVGVVHQSESTFEFKVIVQELDVYFMRKDGTYSATHKYPRFISLESARAKGYDVPVQKVKKSRTFYLYFNKVSGTNMLVDEREIGQVGYEEREITFEWEEIIE